MEENIFLGIDVDTIISLTSIFIASLALLVAIWQGIVTRKHNRLSVRPRLQFDYLISKNYEVVGLCLRNSGTGPLLIDDIALFRNNKKFDISASSYQALFPSLKTSDFTFNIFSKGFVVASNECYWIISTKRHVESDEVYQLILSNLSNFSVNISYKSIYEEQFSGSWSIT
ncbi:hypothetical protein [Vibrio sp. 2-2(8)]|uniref:hypothetical protein n=1 Tax=Vibrio sp. 2-2(8) TaxID=2591014 RepID=UPI00148231AF|nr:hypothetical protein [Vibrio sp. 2-2(8)]NNN49718.1 hypothetical protein [Vibrio sp. 2-2(8)]